MIILRKKRIILVCMCVMLSVCLFSISNGIKYKTTVPTVSLPVTNKVIVLDAGHR